MDKKFITDSLWVGTSKVITRLVGAIFFILVIKILTKEDYGYVRYIFSLASILVVLISTGYSTTLVRFLGLHKKNKKTSERIFSTTVVIVAILFIVFMIGSAILGKFSWGLLILTFGMCFFDLYSALVAGTMQIKKISFFNVLNGVLKILFILPFILMKQYTSALLVISAYTISFLLSGLLLEKPFPTRLRLSISLFSHSLMRKLTKFASNIILSGAVTAIIGSVDLIIIERIMGLSAVATYALAKTFASVLILVPQTLTIILLPKVSSFMKDTKRVNRYFIYSMALVFLSSSAVIFIYYLFGKELILILSTSEYLSSYSLMLMVSIGTFFSALYWVVSLFIIALGKPSVNTGVMIAVGAIYLVLASILISSYSLMGVALAFTIAYLVGFIVILFYYIRYMDLFQKKKVIRIGLSD